jgi:hypothetical protein
MNNESKTNLSKSNVVENSSIITSEESKKDKDLSTSYVDYNEKKK